MRTNHKRNLPVLAIHQHLSAEGLGQQILRSIFSVSMSAPRRKGSVAIFAWSHRTDLTVKPVTPY